MLSIVYLHCDLELVTSQVAAYLERTNQTQPFVVTGPVVWNQLKLGAKSLFAHYLVYTNKLDGEVTDGTQSMYLLNSPFTSLIL
jgi:hypothetical protein